MNTTFDRSRLAVYANYRMSRDVGGTHDLHGWAQYPQGFFGGWVPKSAQAKRSMCRPKPVVYVAGVGWRFTIELYRDQCPLVGCVFSDVAGGDVILSPRPGTKGYLATTPTKRVLVEFS